MSFIHSLDANVVARNRRSSGGTAREGRSGSKLRSIQILRGIAAMAVIAHHAFVGDTKIGAAGVDLFFVISGFIMSTCARDRHAVEFLTDRAWRIYPLWLIAVVPWLFMEHESLLGVVASITLWPVFGNELFSPALVLDGHSASNCCSMARSHWHSQRARQCQSHYTPCA